MTRYVCNFSCGAASAVAAKLAIAQYALAYPVAIVNAYVKNEHPDNRRFLADCEKWLGYQITVLQDTRYGADIVEVFRRKQYMKGRHGAPCSGELKRRVLDAWAQPGDVLVLGFTSEEADRFEDFQEHNPHRPAVAPLISGGLSKSDCKAMVERAGLVLPITYRMGYKNANCLGCVKGGEGYWRAIREDFPTEFEALAKVQESIGPGASFLRFRSGPRKDQRMSLRELPEGKARRNESPPACSAICEAVEKEYSA